MGIDAAFCRKAAILRRAKSHILPANSSKNNAQWIYEQNVAPVKNLQDGRFGVLKLDRRCLSPARDSDAMWKFVYVCVPKWPFFSTLNRKFYQRTPSKCDSKLKRPPTLLTNILFRLFKNTIKWSLWLQFILFLARPAGRGR